jgi:hypothetical protein
LPKNVDRTNLSIEAFVLGEIRVIDCTGGRSYSKEEQKGEGKKKGTSIGERQRVRPRMNPKGPGNMGNGEYDKSKTKGVE